MNIPLHTLQVAFSRIAHGLSSPAAASCLLFTASPARSIAPLHCLLLTIYFSLPLPTAAQTTMYNDGVAVTVLAATNVYLDNVGFTNQTNGASGTIDSDGSIYVDGNWTNNAGNNVFVNIDAPGTVILDGTAAQSIGGTAATHFENLTVQNTGDKTLNVNNCEVNQVLSVDAILNLNGYTLIIDNTATGAVTRTSDYIDSDESENSLIRWNLRTGTGAYVVPWGDSAAYIPLTFDITAAGTESASAYFTFGTYATDAGASPNNRPLPTGVVHTAALDGSGENAQSVLDRWWLITPANYSASPTATITFTYRDNEHSQGTNTITEANLKAQRYDDAADLWGPFVPAGTVNTVANTVQITAQSAFLGPWVLVDDSSPLPIELLSFTARLAGDKVDLEWQTASETNNDYFTVERSKDAAVYEEALRQQGAGNSQVTLRYTDVDPDPLEGLSYYRLRQTDYDGSYSFSDPVPILYTGSGVPAFLVFPNPASSSGPVYFTIGGLAAGSETLVVLIDAAGREAYSRVVVTGAAGNAVSAIDAAERLSPGVYTVTAAAGQSLFRQRLVVTE